LKTGSKHIFAVVPWEAHQCSAHCLSSGPRRDSSCFIEMTVANGAAERGKLEPDMASTGDGSLTFTIPEGVKPGESTLTLETSKSEGGEATVTIRVPAEAAPGDRLVLEKQVAAGWQVRLVRTTVMHPSGSPLPDSEEKRSVTVEVPPGATPNSTVLQVAVGDGRSLKLKVPGNALPGDRIKLVKGSNGEWACHVVKVRSPGASSAADESAPQGSHASAREAEADSVFTLTCEVPIDATPGTTRLRVDQGGSQDPLLVLVPERALGGDKLEIRKDASGSWDVRVLRVQTSVSLDPVDMDVDQDGLFAEMVAAARKAGGFVNEKILRGSAPPLNIMGVVAQGRIEANEEICVMPSGIFLSGASCESAMPALYKAVLNLTSLAVGKRKESALIACVASILGHVRRKVTGEGDEDWELIAKDEACAKLWTTYCHMLLGEAYAEMPLWHVVEDSESMKQLLEPSMEHQDMSAIGGDVVKTHEIICKGVDEKLLGPGFSLGVFMHARLAILSRAFSTGRGTSLVPVTDLFNHTSSPSAVWEWQEERDAHVLVSKQVHEPGEEILISYGKRSNNCLFRTYGFTLPPSLEPVWTYTLNVNDPWGIHRKYLPEHQSGLVIELDSGVCKDSLITAINGCLEARTKPYDFVRDLCRIPMGLFEKDPRLKRPMIALRKVREVNPTSAAWWTIDDALQVSVDEGSSLPSRWHESAIHLKMSEYLCLLAHFEALECLEGTKLPEHCLEAATAMREILVKGLGWAQQGQPFTVTTVESPETESASAAPEPSG